MQYQLLMVLSRNIFQLNIFFSNKNSICSIISSSAVAEKVYTQGEQDGREGLRLTRGKIRCVCVCVYERERNAHALKG